MTRTLPDLSSVIGSIPYRAALAGGWIDQPFVSRLNPAPPGSMVTVGLEPIIPFMDRAGMATGTRHTALRLWGPHLPTGRDRMTLVRELYAEENRHLKDPSGSQDMIGLIYPGINRLDYDASHEGGLFPKHVETCLDPAVIDWLEGVLWVVTVAPRPPGYNPLDDQRLTPALAHSLGQSGRHCYDAILARDLAGLGRSMNDCMSVWSEMMPTIVRHPTITTDLAGILQAFQSRHAGAMYSGCGGGYLYIISDRPVPGAFQVRIRRGD